MRLLLVFSLFFLSLDAFTLKLSSLEVDKGKTVLLELSKEKNIYYDFVAFQKKHFKVFQNPKNTQSCYALVPFSYYTKPSKKYLELHYTKNKKQKVEKIALRVLDGDYKKESIVVSSAKVNPKAKKVKQRISREYKEAMKIYTTVSDKLYIKKPFILPIESTITSEFGKARVYNSLLKGYHSGTDFRAKVGTPIKASNDGRVVLAKKRFYSGGTVIIDHGEGIYTCYFHLSRFKVKKNQLVKRGQIIALSGKSGRVTGPHLHFSARINGVQVDAMQLISLLNKKLLQEQAL